MAISFVDSTSSTSSNGSYTLSRPTGLAEGDLLIAAISAGKSGSAASITVPSGWTLAATTNRGVFNYYNTLSVIYKTAGASEPSTWGGSASGSDMIASATAAYSGAAAAVDQFIDDGTSSKNGANLTTATVNNTDADAWRVTVGSVEGVSGDEGWSTSEVSQREVAGADADASASVLYADSNGTVSTGNHSRTVDFSGPEDVTLSWIGLIKPGSTTVTGTVAMAAEPAEVSVDADAEVSASSFGLAVPVAEASAAADLTVSGSAGVAAAAPAVAVDAQVEVNFLGVETPMAEVSVEGEAEVTGTSDLVSGFPSTSLDGASGTAAVGDIAISAPAEVSVAGLHGDEGTGTVGMSVFPQAGFVGFVPTPVLLVGEEHEASSASGGDANLTVAVPAGTLDGDLLLAFVNEIQDSNLTTPPAGWTLLGAQQGSASTNARGTVYYRIANSEPASYTFDDNDTFGWVWGAAIMAFRNVDQELNGPIHRVAKQGFSAGSTPVTAPSVSTSVRSMILTYMVSVTYSGATSFHTYTSADAGTEAIDWGSENDSSSVSGAVYTKAEQEPGSYGFTVAPSGGNGTQAGRVAFTIALPELSNVDITMGIDAPAPVAGLSATAEVTATTTMATEFPGSAYAAELTAEGPVAMDAPAPVAALEGTAAADFLAVDVPMPSVSVEAEAGVTGATTLDLSAPLVGMNGLVFGEGSTVLVTPVAVMQAEGEAQATGSVAMASPAVQMAMAALSGDPGTGTVGMTAPLSQVAMAGLHDLFGSVEITVPMSQVVVGVETRIFGPRVKVVDAESRVLKIPVDAPRETFYV